MQPMQLTWNKCRHNVWCKLNAVNLEHPHFNRCYGVYVIWHGGSNPAVVYVGQGNIKDRLRQHRNEESIQRYESLGLYVTWASVLSEYRDGVEAYLAWRWQPKVGAAHPSATLIEIKSPWE